MKILQEIKRQLSQGEFEFSRHAFKRAVERNISEAEIKKLDGMQKLSKIILMINALPVVYCLDLRPMVEHCIYKYLLWIQN